MRREETEKWLISVCGLNCAECDIHQAGQGNERLRNEILEWFKTKRGKIVRPEQIRCEGCRGPLEGHWSSNCKMMMCATKRDIQFCFQCSEFPCAEVNNFASGGSRSHKQAIENLKTIKEIGIEEWIKKQKKK